MKGKVGLRSKVGDTGWCCIAMVGYCGREYEGF